MEDEERMDVEVEVEVEVKVKVDDRSDKLPAPRLTRLNSGSFNHKPQTTNHIRTGPVLAWPGVGLLKCPSISRITTRSVAEQDRHVISR